MSALDLGSQARRFAGIIQELLNKTVCDNAQVLADNGRRRTGEAHIGTRLKRGISVRK